MVCVDCEAVEAIQVERISHRPKLQLNTLSLFVHSASQHHSLFLSRMLLVLVHQYVSVAVRHPARSCLHLHSLS